MSQELADNLCEKFKELTGVECDAKFMEKGINHQPTKLENEKKGVYVFLNNDVCFKVGKANSNSQARWNSHHYSLDKSTSSTLTKSFLTSLTMMKKYFSNKEIVKFEKILNKYSLNETNLKEKIKTMSSEEVKELSAKLNLKIWIQNNMNRIEFKIKDNTDSKNFDTNLLEALVQYELKPIFEG